MAGMYHVLFSISDAVFVTHIQRNSLDALVNNAAISGEYEDTISHAPSTKSTAEQLSAALRTNTIGPAITVAAFAELLKKSTQTARIINVTSGAGSISLRLNDTNPHQKMKVVCLRYLMDCKS
jgi:NAD(P)-dependent dehydrogenase (short-subunit alcohol dehydrogenase family)